MPRKMMEIPGYPVELDIFGRGELMTKLVWTSTVPWHTCSPHSGGFWVSHISLYILSVSLNEAGKSQNKNKCVRRAEGFILMELIQNAQMGFLNHCKFHHVWIQPSQKSPQVIQSSCKRNPGPPGLQSDALSIRAGRTLEGNCAKHRRAGPRHTLSVHLHVS